MENKTFLFDTSIFISLEKINKLEEVLKCMEAKGCKILFPKLMYEDEIKNQCKHTIQIFIENGTIILSEHTNDQYKACWEEYTQINVKPHRPDVSLTIIAKHASPDYVIAKDYKTVEDLRKWKGRFMTKLQVRYITHFLRDLAHYGIIKPKLLPEYLLSIFKHDELPNFYEMVADKSYEAEDLKDLFQKYKNPLISFLADRWKGNV